MGDQEFFLIDVPSASVRAEVKMRNFVTITLLSLAGAACTLHFGSAPEDIVDANKHPISDADLWGGTPDARAEYDGGGDYPDAEQTTPDAREWPTPDAHEWPTPDAHEWPTPDAGECDRPDAGEWPSPDAGEWPTPDAGD